MMIFLAMLAGSGLLIVGADMLVRGASRLAAAIGISPLVIGLTVVAFGTSAPEVAVSVESAWTGQSDLAFGNVVGSNICNVLLILGLSALVAPLVVNQQLIRFDIWVMLAVASAVPFLGADGVISRWDGLLLLAGLIVYTVWIIRASRRAQRLEKAASLLAANNDASPEQSPALLRSAALALIGLAVLAGGARMFVSGAVDLARLLGVSELIIGLTIVAVGTSLPEVAASVMASLRGQRDIAVGNVVGSNIFNILSVLGISALVAPKGVIAPLSALRFDVPVMIAVSLAGLPIFFTGRMIARWEGALFLAYYCAYVLYLILEAQKHDMLHSYRFAMIWFVIPLTAVTLTVIAVQTLVAGSRAPAKKDFVRPHPASDT